MDGGWVRPSEVRRSFAKETAITARRTRRTQGAGAWGRRRTNSWPARVRLDYEFLERCKEVVCRVEHPTQYYRYRRREYRVSVLPWSRGAYVDLRVYENGHPLPTGILLHLDVIAAILPTLVATVHRLEADDQRDPAQRAHPQVIEA